MSEDLNVGQWNVQGLKDNNRYRTVRRWVDGLHIPLQPLCLQELQKNEERALFQLGTIFPQGNFALDVAMNGRVGTVVALPTGQVVLDRGCKGDGSLAWVKTLTSKGELTIASIYGDR